ncbi:nuclear transport factor 2 family protein [soil metagenome]
MRGPTDIEQISQLKARYFYHLDAKQWDDYGMVFAQDAVLDVTGEYPDAPDPSLYIVTGRAAIARFVGAAVEGIVTVHHGHMPIITLHDDANASGIWAMEDNLFMADGARMTGFGHYHEEYRRLDGSWFITRCRLTRLRIVLH